MNSIHTILFILFVVMFGSSSSQGNPNGDPELSNPPSDTISSVAWSSKANFIVGASWDKTIRCWEVQCQGNQINSVDKAQQTAEAPILCTEWHDVCFLFFFDCIWFIYYLFLGRITNLLGWL